MSKTLASVLGLWRQDTPLQEPILTTSDTVELEPMERSIKIADENLFKYSLIIGGISGALVAYVVSFFMFTYCDGLKRSGYFPVTFMDRGQKITAMVPMYMEPEEIRKTVWGKK